MFVIDAYSVITFLVAAYVGSLALVIYLGSNTVSSKAFATLAFVISFWMLNVEGLRATPDPQIAEFLVKFTYYLGSIIAACFLYFAFSFPDDKKPPKYLLLLLVAIELLFIPLHYYNLMATGAVPIGGIQGWGWEFGPLWFLFDIFFNGCFILGIYSIYLKFKNYPPGEARTKARFMFWGLIIGVVPPSIVNIILPRLGHFEFNWTGPISGVLWISVIGYSIIKYRQMSVKSVAAEIFVLVIGILLIGNIFADKFAFGAVARIGIFMAFAVMGYLFIKSIVKEAEQKEELKSLNEELSDFNKNLQQKVDDQTKEVRQAYEIEKKARVELEDLNKAKDQFVLATQHHLRTPLTIVRGYMDSLFKDVSSGKVDRMTLESIKKASTAADRLNHLVNELLDVSQMEVGESVLKKSSTDIKVVVDSVITELKDESEKRGIQIYTNLSEEQKDRMLNIDAGKFKEALWNVVDNAVKYNKDKGSVHIIGEKVNHPIERQKKIFKLTITDTGIGISTEELSKLFVMYFERGKAAEELNTTGRGIGLVVARNIINAHGGRIWAESLGNDKGTKFTIELPV